MSEVETKTPEVPEAKPPKVPDTPGQIQSKIRHQLIQLQTLFPTLYPTKVQFTKKLDDSCGDCGDVVQKGKTYLLIRIQKGLSFTASQDTLFHEYAHAMNWRKDNEDESTGHGPHWGVCMSEIWEWYDES